MVLRSILPLVAAFSTPALSAAPPLAVPSVAYHQHLISPAFAKLIDQPVMDGAALLKLLDDAGMHRAVVLSMAYTFGDERKSVADPDSATAAENDWTSSEVVRSNGRLVGFCSANPLRASAIKELSRCLSLPGMIGIKLHFGNSGVSLRNGTDIDALAAVFELANSRKAPLVIHMRSRTGTAFGAEDATVMLDRLLPLAPDNVVQIAHLAGSGGFPEDAEQAMAIFGAAIEKRDPRTRNLWFDLTTVVSAGSTPGDGKYIAKAIRQAGVDRMLFGTDIPINGNPAPKEAWALLRSKVPLTDIEFATIAGNRAPYLK